jgi:hypothetical protein
MIPNNSKNDYSEHYLVGITNRGSEQVEPQMFVMDINSGKANAFAKVSCFKLGVNKN